MASPTIDPEENRVADLFARYLSLRESGGTTSFESWVQDYPDSAQDLRHLYEGWEKFEAEFQAAFPPPSSSFIHRAGRSDRGRDPEAVMSEARSGMVIGEFTLIRKLGQGGMGQVWEARQASLNRHVALKFLRPDRVTPDSDSFIQREARAGGRLTHAGIVAVYATGETEGVRWIAQELVPGGCTFEDFVHDMRGLEELPPDYYRRIARFFVEIADALQTAHRAGVIHRDIKPQNVLVTPDDHPKVTDFGLARIIDEGSLSGHSLVGTPHYMSPEQALGAPLDHRTDVFSLGTLFYEALVLCRPFDGDTQAELYEQILRRDPSDPRDIRPQVPRDLAVIALKALEKRKTARYATMGDFAEDLRRFLDHLPIRARRPGPIQLAQKWIQRHPTASVTAVLAMIFLMVISVALKIVSDQQRTAQESISLAEKHRRENLILQVQWASEMGDLERASHHLELANAIEPDNPDGHLLLAMGYLRFGRRLEADRELGIAVQKGFKSDGSQLYSATHHFHHGLYQYYRYLKDPSRLTLELAEKHLSQAWSMDPKLDGVLYPLYQVRVFCDDDAGAYEALMAYKERLASGNDFYPMVEALGCERLGDYERAAEILEGVAQDPSLTEGRLQELSFHRALGRIYILLGRMEEAEMLLEKAVELFPRDGESWANLAVVSHFLAQGSADSEDQASLWARVRFFALKAHELLPHSLTPLHHLASVELSRIWEDLRVERAPDSEAWSQARQWLDKLRLRAPSDADSLESELLFLEGLYERDVRGDVQRAAERFRASLALESDHVGSALLLGQLTWFDAQTLEESGREVDELYTRALDLFLAARSAWQRRGDEAELSITEAGTIRYRRRKELFYYQAAEVWIFGTAPWIGRGELAWAAREAIDGQLAEGVSYPDEELLSYAEFLATCPDPELADCERAVEVVESYGLAQAFPGHAGAEAILERIRRICP